MLSERKSINFSRILLYPDIDIFFYLDTKIYKINQ